MNEPPSQISDPGAEQAGDHNGDHQVERDLRALLVLHYAQSYVGATERRKSAIAESTAAAAA